MIDNSENNTLTSYLGSDFQLKLLWQLLVEPEFCEKVLPDISVDYFDDPNMKRLIIIMKEFFNDFGKVPNLQNKTINQAVYKYKTPNNIIEEETLFGIINRIVLWNERVVNKSLVYDGDIVQELTYDFIKQQEYRKLGEYILDRTKKGETRNKHTITLIEEKIQKIQEIGNNDDDGEDIFDNVKNVLRKDFREPIPTGVHFIDQITDGGLGKGEIGIILAPSGVGKALPVSAKLLTPRGWIRNGNVKVGDYVIGSDGKKQRVLGVYPQGIRDIYKVVFSDNTTANCDFEHIWSVNSQKQRSVGDFTYQNITTKEIFCNIHNEYKIPTIKPVEFEDCDDIISICHSIENRISSLNNILDLGGYINYKGEICYKTRNYEFSEYIRELVLSLGGYCDIVKKRNLFGDIYYKIKIYFVKNTIKPFSDENKLKKVKFIDSYDKYIVDVVFSHKEEALCIYVENEDHLYVTDDYILTHNTTILTKIANTAYELGKNVAHVIFEDTVEQVKRKHYTIWSKVPLSEIDKNNEKVEELVNKKHDELKGQGHLIVKKFSEEDTTIIDIRNWMTKHQKKYGYNFDILVLDYLDCVESHKKSNDTNEKELFIVKSFIALASDFKIPAWSSIQSNRSGLDAEIVQASQSGGSIKRLQKSHFFMSIAKSEEQKNGGIFATIKIIKSRFNSDGQILKDCIFNNDTLDIRYEGEGKYGYKPYDRNVNNIATIDDIETLRNQVLEKYSDIGIHENINKHSEEELMKKINSDDINDINISEIKDELIQIADVVDDNIEIDLKQNIELSKNDDIVNNDNMIDINVIEDNNKINLNQNVEILENNDVNNNNEKNSHVMKMLENMRKGQNIK